MGNQLHPKRHYLLHTLHWVSSLSPRGWLLQVFLRTPPVSTWYCLAGFHIQPSYMSPWKNWICECTKWCSHVATQEVSSQHTKTLSWTTSYEKMCTWDGKMLQDSVQSDPFIYSHIFWRLATNVLLKEYTFLLMVACFGARLFYLKCTGPVCIQSSAHLLIDQPCKLFSILF